LGTAGHGGAVTGLVGAMNTDPGIEILHFVYQRMRIDVEWCQWGERGFTWWG
jgi:hypothetical protein